MRTLLRIQIALLMVFGKTNHKLGLVIISGILLILGSKSFPPFFRIKKTTTTTTVLF